MTTTTATTPPVPYNTTQLFTETTVPNALLSEHATKAGVWGVIRVDSGRLEFHLPTEGRSEILTSDNPGLIEPEQTHSVTPLGKVAFRVEFYRQPPFPTSDADQN